MSATRLPTYARNAYQPRAARVASLVGAKRTTPDQRGWGQLADRSTEQARLNAKIVIVLPTGGTFEPRVMRDLAPLAELLLNVTNELGKASGFSLIHKWHPDGGLGSFVMRDIRESTAPSWHSWNVAFDLMTRGSPRQFTWRSVIPPWMVDLWESAGWGWGGRWGDGKQHKYDPHHFEYLGRPQDVPADIQRALEAANRIARQLRVTLPVKYRLRPAPAETTAQKITRLTAERDTAIARADAAERQLATVPGQIATAVEQARTEERARASVLVEQARNEERRRAASQLAAAKAAALTMVRTARGEITATATAAAESANARLDRLEQDLAR
jgi:hypothetical protein